MPAATQVRFSAPLDECGIIRVAGAGFIEQFGINLRTRVGVFYDGAERASGRFPFGNAGKEYRLVRLVPRGRKRVFAGRRRSRNASSAASSIASPAGSPWMVTPTARPCDSPNTPTISFFQTQTTFASPSRLKSVKNAGFDFCTASAPRIVTFAGTAHRRDRRRHGDAVVVAVSTTRRKRSAANQQRIRLFLHAAASARSIAETEASRSLSLSRSRARSQACLAFAQAPARRAPAADRALRPRRFHSRSRAGETAIPSFVASTAAPNAISASRIARSPAATKRKPRSPGRGRPERPPPKETRVRPVAFHKNLSGER